MSEADRDPSSLSETLDRILSRVPAEPAAEPVADSAIDVPEIVPATPEPEPLTLPAAPSLPSRPVAPSPEPPAAAPALATTSLPASGPVSIPASLPASVPAAVPAPVTSWGDHVPATGAATPSLRAPGRRPRVRRVTRVVRHVDPWSTFKLSLVFSLVGYLVVLTSGVLLWRVAGSTGTLDNVERWFTQFGWETFELKGGEIFRNAVVIGLFAAVGLTGAAVLAATLFNLVSDIVGGIRVSVLEEEVVERTASSARRYVVRRPPIAGTIGASPAWSVDDPPDTAAAVAATPAATRAPADDWSIDDEPAASA